MGEGVTVVVPTLNRGEMLAATVRDLLEQNHHPLEILVVDQSDEQDPVLLELAQANPGVITYRHVSFRGLPVARNYGWMNARHEAVVYVDDDVKVPVGFVRFHLEALHRDGVGMVAGRIVDARGSSNVRTGPGYTGKFSTVSAVAGRGFDVSGFFEVDHAPGGNFSVWRDVLNRVGGFDERLGAGAALLEETDLCLRVRGAGQKIIFEGAASLKHFGAVEGGCRVSEVPRYVFSFARNRSVIIRRHVSPTFWPIALGRSLLYGLSYALAYRRPNTLFACVRGMVEGWRCGDLQPLCTGGKGPYR
jgi:GT2 family glycosyltransferase